MSALNLKTQSITGRAFSTIKEIGRMFTYIDNNFKDHICIDAFKEHGKHLQRREKCIIQVTKDGAKWEGDIDDLHEVLFDKDDWNETFFEIAHAITKESDEDCPTKKIRDIEDKEGRGGLYDLAKKLTDEFQHASRHIIWEGNYFDTLEKFLKEKLYK